jgi:hypothetical protein
VFALEGGRAPFDLFRSCSFDLRRPSLCCAMTDEHFKTQARRQAQEERLLTHHCCAHDRAKGKALSVLRICHYTRSCPTRIIQATTAWLQTRVYCAHDNCNHGATLLNRIVNQASLVAASPRAQSLPAGAFDCSLIKDWCLLCILVASCVHSLTAVFGVRARTGPQDANHTPVATLQQCR